MAKTQINTKSSNYMRDKEVFLKELKQFNESKSIPYKIPTVNDVDIDLYLFYSLVQQRGGLGKVNQTDAWDSFLRPLRLPHPCINGSTLLRRIYGTYLEKYERARGPPGRDDDNDMDEDPRRGRGGPMQRISYAGTYITASGEPLRSGSRIGGPSERLALSLLSPMPNEQDLAVNVCTVLAADCSNRLPLATTPHVLDFLLAHAGVYNHSSLRDTIGRSYSEARGMYPDEFWRMRAGGGGARELADETKFMAIGIEQPDLMVQALAAHNTLSDCLFNGGQEEILSESEKVVEEELLEDWVTEPSDEDHLFAPDLPGGAKCVYTQRILQVASIVRSLSFHEENVQHLSRNTTLIRFLLLCANCWVGTLRQSGLDTLGNISTELIIKDPATCLISRHILSTVQSSLVSNDRARVLSALELLNKLAQNEANEEVLLRALEGKVYSDVCSLLTLRDIMVLVCTLECVYALTSLGERACEHVARVSGLVHTLVSLVTVEAQSYGPRACILMRVVETVSGPGPVNAAAAAAAAAPAAGEKDERVPHHAPPTTPVKSEARVSPAAHSPAPAQRPASPAPLTTIQQQHLQQQQVQENEQFALAWLRASYEPLPTSNNSGCASADVYRTYLSCCTKLGRKGLIAPAHFPRLVRTVFGGTVGPNMVTIASGETQQVYVGIRARNVPNAINPLVGPSSPILKAQLTSKPGVAEPTKPVAVPQPQQQQAQQPVQQPAQQQHQAPVASHPHLSQVLESNASNTTLIKHLLAHKVSSPQPGTAPAQVAQRQQNQQRVVGQPSGNVVMQSANAMAMEVDPEALIKCTTITSVGVASTIPASSDKQVLTSTVIQNSSEDAIAMKDEPVQIQIDEQSQLTIKAAQNKMLADLLEKKSNPPVQVVQMTGPQMNAPTIQITETGQIVQVKPDTNPIIQIGSEGGQMMPQPGQYIQIKNDQGQIIHLKNDQGQIIQLKSDQFQPQLISQGQVGQVKNDGGMAESVVTDHTYTEPPSKKTKVEEKAECNSPQESVSKTAANLYAALAASALEDEEDLIPTKQESADVIQQSVLVTGNDNPPVITIQEPIMQVQQPTMQIQQPTLQVQSAIQVQQPTLQVQQPMLQVQPMDVQMQNLIASQGGQIILQEKSMSSQQTQFVQQPMQIIATPNTSQGGISYIAQNISGNIMQPHKTIIIVQGGTGGGPITLTVNNPGGLDESTLNSLIAQATEAITQQQIIQNSGVIQSAQRVIVSQPTLVSTSQPITMVKSAIAQNAPQLTPSQQPIITAQPQPHKAQLMTHPQQPQQPQLVVTSKQQPTLITSTSLSNTTGNQIVTVTGNQVLSGPQIITNQQLLAAGNQQFVAVTGNQPMLVNASLKPGVHRMVAPPRGQVVTNVITTMAETKPTVIQQGCASPAQPKPPGSQPLTRQVITRRPIMVGANKIGEKEVIIQQPIIETTVNKQPPKPPTPKPSTTPPVQSASQEDTPWICHWRGCGKSFESAAGVFGHVAHAHCPPGASGEAPCLWLDCDRVPRRTFALLNHLHDKHCTTEALKAIFMSRKHVTSETEASKPVSLGYPPNAALAALNKHAVDFLNPRELMDENEGPVTKSIRLTAALILRNIVIYSNTGRRQLRSYEPHLATIALSSVEASRTISQVLYDMNNI